MPGKAVYSEVSCWMCSAMKLLLGVAGSNCWPLGAADHCVLQGLGPGEAPCTAGVGCWGTLVLQQVHPGEATCPRGCPLLKHPYTLWDLGFPVLLQQPAEPGSTPNWEGNTLLLQCVFTAPYRLSLILRQLGKGTFRVGPISTSTDQSTKGELELTGKFITSVVHTFRYTPPICTFVHIFEFPHDSKRTLYVSI